VDLDVEGTADLWLGGPAPAEYHGGAHVSIPLPAALNIAVAKTFNEKLTVELVYERTYWSSYDQLDFEYDDPVPPDLRQAFDAPRDKSWKDTNTYRIGLTYLYSDRLTLMAGYAYDESPAPDRTLGYELPDSDAHLFSAGFRYKQTENFEWGMALLYDHKVKRSVSVPENENGIDGTFDGGGAILATVGFQYKF